MIQAERYVIGVDYGTLSGRAVVVRVRDGAELASSVLAYPHAVMDETLASTGAALPPEWALQDPADYIEVRRLPAAACRYGHLRPAIRRVPPAARLLRPARQRCDAATQGTAS